MDGDKRFTSFQGRVQDVVLELAAMCDFQVSRTNSVPLDRATEPPDPADTVEKPPPQDPWPWTKVQPPALESLPSFRAIVSGLDPHFNVTTEVSSELELLVRIVFRPGGGYGFIASYLIGRPPLFPATGVINCYHLRSVALPEATVLQERVEEIVQEELDLVSRNAIGPLRSRNDLSGPLIAGLKKTLPDGLGHLKLDYLEGRLSFELDTRRIREADPRAVDLARQLVCEIRSCIPKLRGLRASIDPEVIKIRFTHVLASCHALLNDNRTRKWPPVRNTLTAELFLREFVRGSDEELSRLTDLILTGQRRPQPGPLAVRMMSKLYRLSERQIKRVVLT